MPALSPALTIMTRAVEKAARSLLKDFNEVEKLQVSRKGPHDFVSIADRRAESILREELQRARPGYGFLMEESGAVAGDSDEWRFIIDPLDGTLNFLHGIPHWSITVALEHQGRITHGVTFDPIRQEMFVTERGFGSYLNDFRLRVSVRPGLQEAMLGVGWEERPNQPLIEGERPETMMRRAGAATRRYGSAALDLAYVAAGRFDGFYEYGLSLWDIAAGALMVDEAGGYASDCRGRRNVAGASDKPVEDETATRRSIAAGNPRVHGAMLRILAKAKAPEPAAGGAPGS